MFNVPTVGNFLQQIYRNFEIVLKTICSFAGLSVFDFGRKLTSDKCHILTLF